MHFWRTKDKAEVDFVVQNEDGITPIEVKYSKLKKTTVSRSFRSFITKYSPKTAFIVNLSLETEIMIDSTNVKFIPYWKLLI